MRGLIAFRNLAARLNLPLKQSKFVLPTTCANVCGIEIDTISMEIRLPQEKIDKALMYIEQFLPLKGLLIESKCYKMTRMT